jgi:hypothetical protein
VATKFIFNGREVVIPGAYSQIKSGIQNPALALEYGNVLVINTGSEKLFTGGPGINGTLDQGIESHITFDNSRDMRTYLAGGLWWLLAGPMFSPGGGAPSGAASITYIDAATTVPAEIDLLFGDYGDSDAANDGSITVQVRAEGFAGNAVLGDETRAQSTITISAAGAQGDVISVTVDGYSIGSYTVGSGDTIANVVAGLAAGINEFGLTTIVSQTATTLVIYAPSGYGVDLNTLSPTVVVSGTVAGSAGAFAGGVEGTILTRGYAAKVIAGIADPTKYIVQFWRGSYKGSDSQVVLTAPSAYDGLAEILTVPELVVQSPEVSTVQQLVTWMTDETGIGFTFNQYLKLKTSSIATTDEIIVDDLTTSTYIKALGGTSTFSPSDLTAALTSIGDLVFDFILADNWGTNARSASNIAIHDWISATAKIKPDLIIGGGSVVGEWNSGSTSTIATATAYDSQYATIVHGGAKKIDIGNRAFKSYKSIYKAAVLVGREAGIEPQIPLTFKNIGIEGEVHSLTAADIKLGLGAGVLMTRLDNGSFEVVKGVNSLQNNTYLVNADGSTHSKQFARIERQLNKEIVVNAKTALLKKPNGTNRNTVSEEDVKEFVKGYLNSKVATDQVDNLIINFRAVEVTRNQDAYDITYAFEPNSEISFLFFTGTAVDPT